MYRQLILFALCLLPKVLLSQFDITYLDREFAEGEGYFSQGIDNQPEALCEDTARNRFFVAGSVEVNEVKQMVVRCYQMDGSPDSSWGNQGEVLLDFGVDAYAHAIAIQGAGFTPTIFVAGHVEDGSSLQWAMARLTIDGAPDSLFDSDGLRTLSVGPVSIALDLEPLPSGGILVSGQTGSDLAVAKFLYTGTLDGFFGINGILTIDITSLDSQGKIAADGTGTGFFDDGNFLLASIGENATAYLTRFDEYGTIDQGFGVNGHLELPGLTGDVFPLIDLAFYQEKVGVVGNYSDTAANEALICWELDSNTWQVTGPETFRIGTDHQLAGLAYQPDGNLQVAYKAQIDGQEKLGIFYLTPGLEISFGDIEPMAISLAETPFREGTINRLVGALTQADGKTLFATTVENEGDEEGIVARLGDPSILFTSPPYVNNVYTYSLNKGTKNTRFALPLTLGSTQGRYYIYIPHGRTIDIVRGFDIPTKHQLFDLFFDTRWIENYTSPYDINALQFIFVDKPRTNLFASGEWEFLASCNGGLVLINPDYIDSTSVLKTGTFSETVVGDINGDLFTDIISLDQGGDSLWAFLSQGNGQFTSHLLMDHTGGISILELVDVDGDQDLDLAVGGDASISGGSHIWENDGSGNFVIGTFLSPGATSDFDIADINEDGIEELLYYDAQGASPDLWALSLTSPLGAPVKLVENVTGPGLFRQIDSVAGMEALIFNKVERTLYRATNLDLGGTNEIDSLSYFPYSNLDFMGGLRLSGSDFFMSNYNNAGTQMQLFHEAWKQSPSNPAGIHHSGLLAYHPDDLTDLHLGDIDEDGDVDIIVMDPLKASNDRTGSRFMIWENVDNSGIFKSYTYTTNLNQVETVASYDLDGNHVPEIIGKVGEEIVVLQGVGTTDFHDATFSFEVVGGPTEIPDELLVGDFENNGKIGMMEWHADSGQLLYYEEVNWAGPTTNGGQAIDFSPSSPSTFSTWQGTALIGGRADSSLYTVDVPTQSALFTDNYSPAGNTYAYYPQIVDINQDGIADWLVVEQKNEQGSATLNVLTAAINDGQGGFITQELLEFAGEFTALDYAYNPEWNHVIILANNLPGQAPNAHLIQFTDTTFADLAQYSIPILGAGELTDLKIADLDGDGIPDFVTLDPASGNIWVNLIDDRLLNNPVTHIQTPAIPAPQLSLFPNPAQDQLTLLSKDQLIQRVMLRDMQGRMIRAWSAQSAKVELSVSDIPAGLYVVQVVLGDGEVQGGKVMIRR